MKAQELRIGNYVNTSERSGNIYQICRQGIVRTINNGSCNITPNGCSSPVVTVKLKNIEPIPLTEEWLMKFGFRTHDHHDYFIDISPASDFRAWLSVFQGNGFFYIDAFDIKFKYVHQLQNLFFALTGEELTIV